MKNYAESEIFPPEEVRLWKQAVRLIEAIPDEGVPEFRCHELARAVGHRLGLKVQDGRYGFVEHTWLWVTPFENRWFLPNILDVYVPGRLPQIQLIHTNRTVLPVNYSWTEPRGDIREDIVRDLCSFLTSVCLVDT